MNNQKLKEIFESLVNQSIDNLEFVSQGEKKAEICAQLALAIATVIGKEIPAEVEETFEPEEYVESVDTLDELIDDAVKITAENEALVKAIDEKIKNTKASEPEVVEENVEWQVPYDENGMPYITEEDKKVAWKYCMYVEALDSPEVKSLQLAAAEKIMKESEQENIAFAPATEEIASTPVVEEVQVVEEVYSSERLESLKTSFGYYEDPSALDSFVYYMSSGVIAHVADLTNETTEPFILFMEEQLNTAYSEVEGYKKEEWIGEDGINSWLKGWYGDDSADSSWIGDGNVIQFAAYARVQVATAWYGQYLQSWGEEALTRTFKEFMDESSVDLSAVSEENICAFVEYLNSIQ